MRNNNKEESSSSSSSSSLRALILSENPIGDGGMELLCQALRHNRSLMLLAVGDCRVTDKGMAVLAHCLRHYNCSLQRLYSYGNAFTNKCESSSSGADHHLEVRYWLDLNARGRSFLRSDQCRSEFLPRMLSKVSEKPEVLYGLLRELPHLWGVSRPE
jgi:Ran GTPase-activating protein (RanGAP) involved in mRNA processing and transport